MSTTANVALAALGGLLIGTACTVYMMVAGKVAGCSGSVKACVLATAPGLSPKAASEPPTYHGPNILFFVGLVAAGAVVTAAAPWCFEAYLPLGDNGWLTYSIGGLLVGTGTYLGNGCTSGHGLAGLSRLSLRSLAATPTFMFAAALTAMIKTQFAAGPIAPFVAMTSEQFAAYGWVVLGLCVLSSPIAVLHVRGGRDDGNGPQGNHSNRPPTVYYAGAWCGLTFGAGLCFGGWRAHPPYPVRYLRNNLI